MLSVQRILEVERHGAVRLSQQVFPAVRMKFRAPYGRITSSWMLLRCACACACVCSVEGCLGGPASGSATLLELPSLLARRGTPYVARGTGHALDACPHTSFARPGVTVSPLASQLESSQILPPTMMHCWQMYLLTTTTVTSKPTGLLIHLCSCARYVGWCRRPETLSWQPAVPACGGGEMCTVQDRHALQRG